MSLKKGFLRACLLKPSRLEWVLTACIFLISSFFIHLLIVYAYEFILFAYTRFFTAGYLGQTNAIQTYSWFIGSFSSVSGLNFAFAFLLQNHLIDKPGKHRLATRISFHYASLNVWSYMAWVTRLMYHLVFLVVIFLVELPLKLDFDIRFVMVLLITNYFFGTWLMAHRILRKDYPKVLRASAACLLFAFALAAIKPINFDTYNRYVQVKSVYSEGDFEILMANAVTMTPYEWRQMQLFLYGNKHETYPKIRVWKRGSFSFIGLEELTGLFNESEYQAAIYVNTDVTLKQVWALENAIRLTRTNKYIYYKASAPFEPWSVPDFSFRWYSESRFVGACELNDPDHIEGKACRGIIDPEAKEVLHIQFEKDLTLVNNQAMNSDLLKYSVRSHLNTFGKEAIILIEPDRRISFSDYVSFKDQIQMLVIELRKEYVMDKYGLEYEYPSYLTHHRYKAKEEKEAEERFPMYIVNYDRESGLMFSDYQ